MVPSDDDSDLPEDAEPEPPDLGPEVPSVDVPGPDEGLTESLTPESDVDPETHRTFWRLVVVIDVALLALTVGPMLIYFEGDWRRGLAMVSLGLVVSVYGLRTYRGYMAEDAGNQDASDPENAEKEGAIDPEEGGKNDGSDANDAGADDVADPEDAETDDDSGTDDGARTGDDSGTGDGAVEDDRSDRRVDA